MNCPNPNCQQEIQADWGVCPYCQTILKQVAPPQEAPPYIVPATAAFEKPDQEGDATGGIIPYKNPKALIAYYLGIASGLPVIGFPIGVTAFILGIMGLRDRKRNPAIKGSLHAWVGIGCGGIFMLFWGAVSAILVYSLIMG